MAIIEACVYRRGDTGQVARALRILHALRGYPEGRTHGLRVTRDQFVQLGPLGIVSDTALARAMLAGLGLATKSVTFAPARLGAGGELPWDDTP